MRTANCICLTCFYSNTTFIFNVYTLEGDLMNTVRIESFELLHQRICDLYNRKIDIYRGVSDVKYKLVPKIGWIPIGTSQTVTKLSIILYRGLKRERCLTSQLHQDPSGIG